MLSSHTNPILADIRANIGNATYPQMLKAMDYSWFVGGHFVTVEWVQIKDPALFNHARRVLSRLASLNA